MFRHLKATILVDLKNSLASVPFKPSSDNHSCSMLHCTWKRLINRLKLMLSSGCESCKHRRRQNSMHALRIIFLWSRGRKPERGRKGVFQNPPGAPETERRGKPSKRLSSNFQEKPLETKVGKKRYTRSQPSASLFHAFVQWGRWKSGRAGQIALVTRPLFQWSSLAESMKQASYRLALD